MSDEKKDMITDGVEDMFKANQEDGEQLHFDLDSAKEAVEELHDKAEDVIEAIGDAVEDVLDGEKPDDNDAAEKQPIEALGPIHELEIPATNMDAAPEPEIIPEPDMMPEEADNIPEELPEQPSEASEALNQISDAVDDAIAYGDPDNGFKEFVDDMHDEIDAIGNEIKEEDAIAEATQNDIKLFPFAAAANEMPDRPAINEGEPQHGDYAPAEISKSIPAEEKKPEEAKEPEKAVVSEEKPRDWKNLIILVLLAALLLALAMLFGRKLFGSKGGDVTPTSNEPQIVETTQTPAPDATNEPVVVEPEEKPLADLIKVKDEEIELTQYDEFDPEENLEIDEEAKDRYTIEQKVDTDVPGEYEVNIMEKDAADDADPVASYKVTVNKIVYAVGEGPMGTAGRIYLPGNDSFKLERNDIQRVGTGINILNGIVPANYNVGDVLSWVDAEGWGYDYKCIEKFEVYKDNGNVYLDNGVAVEEADYGELVLVDKDYATFWVIQ